AQNISELLFEKLLINHGQKIGHVITLVNLARLMRQQTQKKITRKEWLLERHGLAAVPFHTLVERQRDRKTLALAVLGQFFFTARSRVSAEPGQVSRGLGRSILFKLLIVHALFCLAMRARGWKR